MSENETGEINLRELSQEDYKKLIQHASDTERKLILILERFRQFMHYRHHQDFDVIKGDVIEIVLDKTEKEEFESETVAIVPKTVPTIIYYWSDSSLEQYTFNSVFVFDGNGWKEVEINNT